MATTLPPLFSLGIALVIPTIIIYAITKFFGEREGIVTALIAALAGSAICTCIPSSGDSSRLSSRGSRGSSPSISSTASAGSGPSLSP
jgi:hypothetical protein